MKMAVNCFVIQTGSKRISGVEIVSPPVWIDYRQSPFTSTEMASSLKKRNNRSLLKICVLILERLLKNNSSFILLLMLCYLLCQGKTFVLVSVCCLLTSICFFLSLFLSKQSHTWVACFLVQNRSCQMFKCVGWASC